MTDWLEGYQAAMVHFAQLGGHSGDAAGVYAAIASAVAASLSLVVSILTLCSSSLSKRRGYKSELDRRSLEIAKLLYADLDALTEVIKLNGWLPEGRNLQTSLPEHYRQVLAWQRLILLQFRTMSRLGIAAGRLRWKDLDALAAYHVSIEINRDRAKAKWQNSLTLLGGQRMAS